jgi:hypothetical protein
MLVLARLQGSTLTVVTPPLYDDSLPGAQPLLDADGVTYARLWPIQDTGWTPTMIRAEWTGNEWRESDVLPAGSVSAGPETGQAIAQDPLGGYWIKDAGEDGHGGVSTLVHVAPGSTSAELTDIDMTNVDWFCWVTGPE